MYSANCDTESSHTRLVLSSPPPSPPQIWLRNKIIHEHLLEQRVRLVLPRCQLQLFNDDEYVTYLQPIMRGIFIKNLSRGFILLTISTATPVTSSLTPYLEDYNEPHIPHAFSLHIGQVQWRIQRLATLRPFNK